MPTLRLVRATHEAGINLRHLGRVRKLLDKEQIQLRTVLLVGAYNR